MGDEGGVDGGVEHTEGGKGWTGDDEGECRGQQRCVFPAALLIPLRMNGGAASLCIHSLTHSAATTRAPTPSWVPSLSRHCHHLYLVPSSRIFPFFFVLLHPHEACGEGSQLCVGI